MQQDFHFSPPSVHAMVLTLERAGGDVATLSPEAGRKLILECGDAIAAIMAAHTNEGP